MLTIKQCEQLFSFVESNVGVWKEDTFFTPCKTMVLRMCNDLLRRLSRSQNTVFCGRILLFLARFFPFSERSGLNLVSEFNHENVTTFTNVETTDMEDDEDEEKGEENRLRLGYTLYTKFWSLQDFFRNPVQCFQKAPWKMFTVYCGDVLEAFRSFKLDNVQSSGSGGAHLTRTLSEPTHSNESSSLQPQVDQYFAKYLTNQKLLDLQFSDTNFRRYVLLQILILAQYLTSNIKFKQETLTEEQSAWVKKTEEVVYSLLEETPPDGPVFVTTVKHILKREEMWSEWKNEGCPEFKKPEGYEKRKVKQNGKVEEKEDGDTKSSKKLRQKRKVGDIIRDADSKNKFSMGKIYAHSSTTINFGTRTSTIHFCRQPTTIHLSPVGPHHPYPLSSQSSTNTITHNLSSEMTRLWNLNTNNLEACKMLDRDFVPALETYFTPAIEQLSPKSELKEQDRLVNDSNFGWRGLRLLACRSPHFFTHSASPIATLPEYLTTMIKKLAKDLPSQLTADIKVEEEDDKEEEKVIPVLEQNDGVKEEEEDMEEDGGDEERADIKAITEEEQKALAKNFDKLCKDKWKLLAKKLGFEDDEIEFIEKEKASKEGSVESQVAYMLKLWVENEGDEANKESLLYTLGGMKMAAIADGIFT
nr:THO complex subunit 1-like isoform X1 [Cherax quadricarinatus]